MIENGLVIEKNPALNPAEDYYALRQQGITAIEELGSAAWTDYNAHDPGITTLEALCYALSEAGYRIGFDIADILTEKTGVIGFRQALFTARRILTNCALTTTDFRKILVDEDGVRNAWLICKKCPCELTLYAECKENGLFFAPLWRLDPPFENETNRQHEHPVNLYGFYDVLLELDEDPELGDLNDRKVLHNVNYALPSAGEVAPLTIEVRFPEWETDQPVLFARFSREEALLTSVQITRFSRDRVLAEPVTEASFVQGWRGVFFADYTLKFKANSTAVEETLMLHAASIRFFSPKESVKREVIIANLVSQVLADATTGGIAGKYQSKLQKIGKSVADARFLLHQNRNLAEDFCHVSAVRVQDVAVCADIEVAVEADLEWVLANVYSEIELYFNLPIRFYTLTEMAAAGYATDVIFDGPPLENGFIKDEELAASELRTVLHLSDIVNRLMDIPGVVAVRDVQITLYDEIGNPQLFPKPWSVAIPAGHLPRLYLEASRFLFYKNGLPFLPRMEEARAILAQLRGERTRPKIPVAANDYPVPTGRWSDLAEYFPVQHSFPETYGIGPNGLPARASATRQAQAKHLKAYLMPFEQLIGNLLSQLANVNALFSTDETLDRTYFGHHFDPVLMPSPIADLRSLYTPSVGLPNLTAASLQQLLEPREVFYDRRNRFLDHLMARFGEQFRDYALMLYANSDRVAFAPDKLILDKIRFLRFYPRISAARAKAFNYRDEAWVCDYRNQPGLLERVSRLLGMETIKSAFAVTVVADPNEYVASFELKNSVGTVLLTNDLPILGATGEEAEDVAWEMIGHVIANATDPARYVGGFLLEENGIAIAELAAGVLPAAIIAFVAPILAKERAYLVEHLLLRPKFPGDAVLPVCLTDDCSFCGEEDPYSFRLTFVLQGNLQPFSEDIDLRRFADNTIRKETPAHLLPKICWVGNAGAEPDPCAAIFGRIAAILQKNDAALSLDNACTCAAAVHTGFDAQFQTWFTGKELELHPPAIWRARLETLYTPVTKASFPCTLALPDAAWADIKEALLVHFADLATNGFQFDRFEKAWCAWLEANTGFDWPVLNDLLHRRVQALLERFLPRVGRSKAADACACANLLLGYFGNRFRAWIDDLIDADLTPTTIPANALETRVWDEFVKDLQQMCQFDLAFCLPKALLGNTLFMSALKDLFLNPYRDWIAVSWRLNLLLRLFSNLSSIYPVATLHDCDDGADDNPVRLNNTILGSM
jgi:hypothetical protein